MSNLTILHCIMEETELRKKYLKALCVLCKDHTKGRNFHYVLLWRHIGLGEVSFNFGLVGWVKVHPYTILA